MATDGTGSTPEHRDSAPRAAAAEPGAGQSARGERRGAPLLVALEPRWLRRSLLLIFLAVVLFQVVMWSWEALAHFAFLILLSWLIAIAIDPVVSYFAAKGMRRGLATGLVMLVVALLTAAFIGSFGSLMVAQITMLIENLPTFLQSAVNWVNDVFKTNFDPSQLNTLLNLTPAQIAEYLSTWAGGLLGVVSGTLGFLFEALTVLVFAFYLSADSPRIKRTVAGWLPPDTQRIFINVWDISVRKAGGFVISKAALAFLSAIAHSAFFWAISVPFWLPLGIFAGVVSQFIPTIGTYIGVALPALIAVFADPWDVVWIIAFATVYQQIENYVFTPKMSKATMDIHSGLALAAVFIGAALFGPIGALIGIPLMAIVLAVVETYVARFDLAPDLAERSAAGGFGDARRKSE